MGKVIFLLVLLLLVPSAYAASGSIKLLAARETDSIIEGSVADLTLETQPGRGRVFIHTFPLTKLDTQISTRFAKEIACDMLDMDCSIYDFIYTIKSDSSIVGGPSAGAAIAVLTAAVVKGLPLDNNVAVTGTINSGSFIGPVGSIKEKIEGAFNAGLTKVLIPKGRRFVRANITIDLVEYGSNLGIEVVEVSDLRDALFEFSGVNFSVQLKELDIDKDYSKTMGFLGNMLCNRTDYLQKLFLEQAASGIAADDMLAEELSAINLTLKGRAALDAGRFYSAASYCYGANVKYRTLVLRLMNMTDDEVGHEILRVNDVISRVEASLSARNITTITDLQTFMIVKERLYNARQYLDSASRLDEDSVSYLALAVERLYSAGSWSFFFNMPGRKFNLNKETLKESCLSKISEAEERIQYVNLYLPLLALEKPREDVGIANSYLKNDSFELCLFSASRAKAEADAILSVIGADEGDIDSILEEKLKAARRSIIEQSSRGVFPIVGYSYYEYAGSLKEYDSYSSLLYLEYALELSNIDVYFREGQLRPSFRIPNEKLALFIAGMATGIALCLIIRFVINPRKCSEEHLRGKKR